MSDLHKCVPYGDIYYIYNMYMDVFLSRMALPHEDGPENYPKRIGPPWSTLVGFWLVGLPTCMCKNKNRYTNGQAFAHRETVARKETNQSTGANVACMRCLYVSSAFNSVPELPASGECNVRDEETSKRRSPSESVSAKRMTNNQRIK